VALWSYCAQTLNTTTNHTSQNCSSPKSEFWFDPFTIWNLNDTSAESAINSTTLTDALKTYKTASRWTFVLYLLAAISTVVEILFGVVAIFSRIGSCCTTIISSFSTLTIVLASILATVMWSVLTAAFNHELKKFGLSASVSGKMLAVSWLAAVFSIASGFFWMISICCCGDTHRSHFGRNDRQPRHLDDMEKLPPVNNNGPYQQVPVGPNTYNQPAGYSPQQEYGQTAGAKPTRDMASSYEPYRHNDL